VVTVDGTGVVLNGSTTYDAVNHDLVLTLNAPGQAGSAILNQAIDLTHNFQASFDVNLGNNPHGADGLAFCVENDPLGTAALGAAGGNYGAVGIKNGLGIAFDTYQNAGEIAADHTDLFTTADGTQIGPEAALGNGNIKDGNWHNVVINWDAATHTLTETFDGTGVVDFHSDIAATYLDGSQSAYLGFSGGTGGLSNQQEVHLDSLTAQFATQPAPTPAATPQVIALDGAALLNGSATYNAVNNNFALTPDAGSQAGSAMFAQKLDLTHDFDIDFSVYLGNNAHGADGLAFVLQNDPNGTAALGAAGGNYGAVGIKNGLGVAFDTYQNAGEIAADHTDFFNTADGTVIGNQVALGNGNIKDGNWHSVDVSWNSTSHTLTESFDDNAVATLTQDIATSYLGGSQSAYFGFTGGTGGLHNLQEVHLASLKGWLI
jgi:hypothetical protein